MKTPKIKELRALAKRKGMVYEEVGYSDATWCHLFGGSVDVFGWTNEAPMRVVVNAALRALPDKKVAR